MNYTILILSFLLFFSVNGQESFYEKIPLGTYKIGYCDTIIYDENKPYSQFGYNGAAPLFLQIWHPLKKSTGTDFLTYGDFQKREVPEKLSLTYAQLNAHSDTCFINYNLLEQLATFETVEYGVNSVYDVLKSVKSIKTRSSSARIQKKSNYPVIVYHHGAQGLSAENYMMAEYFASRGYIVVTSNFHLPFANTLFGALPFELWNVYKNDQSMAKTVIRYARTLTKSDHLFFVGHSWGAQEGWSFLHEPGWADAFVSMETTLEYHSEDSAFIKELWPQVYDVIVTKQKKYALPVLLFANTLEDKPFGFFENTSDVMYHVSEKDTFEHGAYTAAYLMRYYMREQFMQPDTALLHKRIELYGQHLTLMEAFFQSIIKKKALDRAPFSKHFYIN